MGKIVLSLLSSRLHRWGDRAVIEAAQMGEIALLLCRRGCTDGEIALLSRLHRWGDSAVTLSSRLHRWGRWRCRRGCTDGEDSAVVEAAQMGEMACAFFIPYISGGF